MNRLEKTNPWTLLVSAPLAVAAFNEILTKRVKPPSPQFPDGSPSFLHSSIMHISYPPHPFLHPLDCARAFYYTFWLSFVSLLHTPISHISFAHIQSSTSSLLHTAFSTQSDCAQCLFYTSRFNTTNPPHPFPGQLVCARKLGRHNSHKYLTRVR